MTKICTGCKVVKSLTEFFKDKGFKDGYYSKCKECKTKATLKWRSDNKEHYNNQARKFNKKHYNKLRLNRYGITEEEYNDTLNAQEHKCAIPGCNKKATEKRKLAIDHDHVTGEVRGLLCYKCNRDMVVIDDPEHMSKLMLYKETVRIKRLKP